MKMKKCKECKFALDCNETCIVYWFTGIKLFLCWFGSLSFPGFIKRCKVVNVNWSDAFGRDCWMKRLPVGDERVSYQKHRGVKSISLIK